MKKLLVLFFLAITISINAQNITGDWNGALEIQGMQLRIVFHLTEENGKLVATLDSPDQGASGIPMDEATFENNKLTILASKMGMKYTAELNQDQSKIEGTFNQGPMSLPLEMSREK